MHYTRGHNQLIKSIISKATKYRTGYSLILARNFRVNLYFHTSNRKLLTKKQQFICCSSKMVSRFKNGMKTVYGLEDAVENLKARTRTIFNNMKDSTSSLSNISEN